MMMSSVAGSWLYWRVSCLLMNVSLSCRSWVGRLSSHGVSRRWRLVIASYAGRGRYVYSRLVSEYVPRLLLMLHIRYVWWSTGRHGFTQNLRL